MVASSVVTTIMILNYHHRQADTHTMPTWVSLWFVLVCLFGPKDKMLVGEIYCIWHQFVLGEKIILAVDSLASENV